MHFQKFVGLFCYELLFILLTEVRATISLSLQYYAMFRILHILSHLIVHKSHAEAYSAIRSVNKLQAKFLRFIGNDWKADKS